MSRRLRLRQFCIKLTSILFAAGVVMALPDSNNMDFVRYKNAGVAFFTVVLIGVLLFDTFFYDRYGG